MDFLGLDVVLLSFPDLHVDSTLTCCRRCVLLENGAVKNIPVTLRVLLRGRTCLFRSSMPVLPRL